MITEDMEHGEFEKNWQKALKSAEADPSASAWSAIESELIAAENQTMRRRIVVYQRLAAASLIFAALIGASAFYYYSSDSASAAELASLKSSSQNQAANLNRTEETPNAVVSTPASDNVPDKASHTQTNGITAASIPGASRQNGSTLTNQAQVGSKAQDKTYAPFIAFLPLTHEPTLSKKGESRKSSFGATPEGLFGSDGHGFQTTNKAFVLPDVKNPFASGGPELLSGANPVAKQTGLNAEDEESPVRVQKKPEETIAIENPYAIADRSEDKKAKPEKSYKEELWASVGMSAGSYNPSVPTSNLLTAVPGGRPGSTVSKQNSPGNSYSVGIAVGKRVSEKWVVLTGVNYMNQSTGYASNLVTFSSQNSSHPSAAPASTQTTFLANQTVSTSNVPVAFSGTYPVNSTLEYVSLPVQAGYVLIDKKIGFQMNAGMAADFFLRNTLQDESGQASSFTQGAGSASPYRSLNLAGLVSTEFSYKLARQYRVSLVPGMRYALNPAFKNGAGNPYVMDIGFRFKYLIR